MMAELGGDRRPELIGQSRRVVAGRREQHVPALDVGRDVDVAEPAEQRPQLSHRHRAAADVDAPQQRDIAVRGGLCVRVQPGRGAGPTAQPSGGFGVPATLVLVAVPPEHVHEVRLRGGRERLRFDLAEGGDHRADLLEVRAAVRARAQVALVAAALAP